MATGGRTGAIEKNNIVDLVTCPLCLDYYQSPKLIPCGHSFCLVCLQQHINQTLTNGTFFCPICRRTTKLPEEGADGFMHNFLVVNLQDVYNKVPSPVLCDRCTKEEENSVAHSICVDCSMNLCPDCTKVHKKVPLTKGHTMKPLDTGEGIDESGRLAPAKCQDCNTKQVRYYCSQCQTCICHSCKDLDHANHDTMTIGEAMKEKRDGINRDLLDLENNLTHLRTTNDHISKNIATLRGDKKSLPECIGKAKEHIIMMTIQAANKTIDDVKCQMDAEIRTQELRQEEAQLLQAHVESYISLANVLSNGTDDEIFRCNSLLRERKIDMEAQSVCIPEYRIPILQTTLDATTSIIEKWFTLICAENSPVNPSIHQPRIAGQMITTGNSAAQRDKSPVNQPPIDGLQATRDNPATQRGNSPINQFPIPGLLMTRSDPAELRPCQTIPYPSDACSLPTSIALHGDNTINVFVCVDSRLYQYDGKTWTDTSSSHNSLRHAYGVCVNNNTVVVSTKSVVQLVHLVAGDINTTRQTIITLPFKSNYPRVACGRPVNGQPTYYVMERQSSGNAAVHHIDDTGNILQTYDRGELTSPNGVSVDVDGDLVVTEGLLGVNDVIIYNRDGSVKRRLRQHNHLSTDQMSGPLSVCVDGDGYIFVSSYHTHSVLLFSPTGDYIRTVLTSCPTCTWVAVSQHGHLAVVNGDRRERVIKLYTYRNCV